MKINSIVFDHPMATHSKLYIILVINRVKHIATYVATACMVLIVESILATYFKIEKWVLNK